jgi:predicted nucleotidyltransferase
MHEPQFDAIFEDTPVLVAYLFGSHAAGRASSASDRDVAVLLAPGLSRREQEWFDWEPRYRRLLRARVEEFAKGLEE